MPVYTEGKGFPIPFWDRNRTGSRKLSRKQVGALSRALKRKGRKLPKVGYCSLVGGGAFATEKISVEVCHGMEGGKHVYRSHVMDRRRRR